VFVDRGSVEGVMRGMAVVTGYGIVGKVIAAYPTASEVLLVTDPEFAAGVVSQKSQARGTFKGQGNPLGKVDYVPTEEKVAEGEWFYTSGDDRVFPRGFPVGQTRVVRPGQPFQEILVEPSGLQRGLEDVLIVVAGVHQDIPDSPPVNQPVYIAPAPPALVTGSAAAPTDAGGMPLAPGGTEADKLRQQYKAIGDAQNHKFGEGAPGSIPPDFTKLGQTAPVSPAGRAPAGDPAGGRASTGTSGSTPPTTPVPSAARPADGGKKPPADPPPGGRASTGTSGTNPTNTPDLSAKRPVDAAKKPPADPPASVTSAAGPAGGRASAGTSSPNPTNAPAAPAKRPIDATKKPSPPAPPPVAQPAGKGAVSE
jgi:rod shape-determining protein MreC